MNLARCGILQFVVFLFLLVLYSGDAAPQLPFRNRNLIPFPRVGRRDTSQDTEDKLNEDYFAESKIRRGGNKNMNTGLWFGPRLGRIQKRKSYVDDAMGYLLFRDLGSSKHIPKYTPRLGRDSEEIFEELSENNQTSY